MRSPFFLLCATLTVCFDGAPGSAAPPLADRLDFEMVTREQTYGDCVAGADDCACVRLRYPVVVGGPEGYAVDAVADAVFALLDPGAPEGESSGDVDTVMQVFLDDYRESRRDEPDGAFPWFLERQVSVVHNTPKILSLGLFWRSYLGGAHGMAASVFRALDPRTGRSIGLADILVDGYEDELLPLAEARFREVHVLEEGTTLEEAGFVFDDDTFALAENVRIDGEGLAFHYNPYDVAPYSFGATEVVLTWDELAGLLKEEARVIPRGGKP